MITKQDIYNTASLLHISIEEQEADTLQASLTQIVDYFTVMEKVLEKDQSIDTAITDTTNISTSPTVQYRNDKIEPYCNTQSLIEKSEEHEENFIIIPNIL